MSSQNSQDARRTPEEIQANIEQQREQLAGTLDALTAKLDVKSHAQAKVADARATTRARLTQARAHATTESGGPRPELLVFAGTVVVVTVALVWWRRR